MAKRQKNHQVSVAFNYLVKLIPDELDPDQSVEEGFSPAEFRTVVERLSDVAPLNVADDVVISVIKRGDMLPLNYYEDIGRGNHFGDFEGAYYGQKYRNNILGTIDADSLNLRSFHYLVTRLANGRILIGVTYHGMYGDYDGFRKLLSSILRGDYRVCSRTLKSVDAEIGRGRAVSLKLTYRKAQDRPERQALFGSAGVVAISSADLGENFERQVADVAGRVQGTEAQRKQIIAAIVNQGHLLELDADDIVGCSAVVREEGRQRTVYFIGENLFSTKFPLNVDIDVDGIADRGQVAREMIRVMREKIIPLLPRVDNAA